jgi:hypothetical protein
MVSLVRSVQASATFDSRVVFDLVRSVKPYSLPRVLGTIREPSLQAGTRKLAEGTAEFERISEKLGERILGQLVSFPENLPAFSRILAQIDHPKRFENARALQQDALAMALKAFGAPDGAAFVTLSDRDTALARIRLQEDAVIEHDARWIPGWDLNVSYLTGHAVFTQQTEQLHVYTANKRPLEELFGVDLIYLNERRGALIMVQYKMMGPSERKRRKLSIDSFDYDVRDEKEWTVSIDAQFIDELGRMSKFNHDLSPDGPYRLHSGPFFFKLVKRFAAASTSGIILSLGPLEQMIAEGAATGPRGGLRISYQTLDGHYLRSDAFIELVRSGYVGSRGATTNHFRSLINAALEGGRSVVAAISQSIESDREQNLALDVRGGGGGNYDDFQAPPFEDDDDLPF